MPEWETLHRHKRFIDYCSTCYIEAQAMEDTSAIRNVMKAFMDDHILSRCRNKLQEAKSVRELFQVLKDQEQVFWPTQKAQNLYQNKTEEWGGPHDLPV